MKLKGETNQSLGMAIGMGLSLAILLSIQIGVYNQVVE